MEEYFKNITEKVNKHLIKDLKEEGAGTLESAMYYALSLKGKRLRPLILLTLLDAWKLDYSKYMNVACAIEYIHTYSLLHDDLPCMDDDDYRRGMPTVHKQFNEAISLLTGDTLLTEAFELIAKTDLKPEATVAIVRTVTECIGRKGMAGGQVLDLEFDGVKDDISHIHRMKTADLIRACFLCAGEIAGVDEKGRKLLYEAGESIGIAFQMADDLLDIEGDEEKVGKKLGKDLNNSSPNSVIHLGREFVVEHIEKYYRRTIDILQELGIEDGHFHKLMHKMVYRNK